MAANALYFGDNLDILRDRIPSESVDLIYLDPPFNSNRDYNVIFKDESGRRSDAQVLAFEDTWHWTPKTELTYAFLTESVRHRGAVSSNASTLIAALRSGIGENQMLAYLVEMTARLVELHRVLKPTGSLYLHCDPTASHYLKVVLDAIFGAKFFRNEIVLNRTNARSTVGRWPRLHDTLLFYTKSDHFTFRPTQVQAKLGRQPHTLITGSDGKKYQTYELTAPGITQDGESGRPWRGFSPSKMGRHVSVQGV